MSVENLFSIYSLSSQVFLLRILQPSSGQLSFFLSQFIVHLLGPFYFSVVLVRHILKLTSAFSLFHRNTHISASLNYIIKSFFLSDMLIVLAVMLTYSRLLPSDVVAFPKYFNNHTFSCFFNTLIDSFCFYNFIKLFSTPSSCMKFLQSVSLCFLNLHN